MKRRRIWGFVQVIFAMLLVMVMGCSQKKVVSRIDPSATVDLSGRWNDTDSRLVAEEMVADCLSHVWITDHMADKMGKKPSIIVGAVKNLTTEHISVTTFLNDIEGAIINSGKVRLVASAKERESIREERLDQWENASPETVKKLGVELGADYMLSGSVNSIMDEEDGEKIAFYQTDLTLLRIETNEKVWMGQKKIKKYIARKQYKP
ncbi:MAG: penicillin-binding protein activator LpoB [Candidatus Eisenbacteria bacterium]|uniref:Penicillin-binding protein activator LpoB n=1 Tax=Eiseniibacteriota bacterium TaxID=2212470 RepID=A0A948RTY7_UNCEI|nr:penicillin-binding protein activator LpoB [Candidatus Eisenbacteria bacterium]MBU1948986.1 penicillin-binding protein activator LpoB [Candidatus Eisenbacteria bacterium]MBU2690501.1 penicillin-binding protein activator LpoB [Candidatus Eisenbacteria bacterium]